MSHSPADSPTQAPAEYPYHRQPPIVPVADRIGGVPGFPSSIRGWPLAIALSLAAVLGNLCIFPIAEIFNSGDWGILWLFVLAGGLLAQAAVLSMLLVFGEQSFWRRLVSCWSAAVILWGFWAAGGVAGTFMRHSDRSLILLEISIILQLFGLALPLAGLVVQSPLWFFRLYLGWRLTSPAEKSVAAPLTIHDYLVGIAIAAVSLSLARLARLDTSPTNTAEHWWNWGVFSLIAASVSLFSVIPAMLLLFRCRDWRIGYVLLLVHGVFGGLVFMGLIAIHGTTPPLWDVVYGVILFFAFAVFLGAGMMAIRDMGFSLVLRRTDAEAEPQMKHR